VRSKIADVDLDEDKLGRRAERLTESEAMADAVHRLYANELSRIRHLEGKLQAHTSLALALTPLVIGIGAIAINRGHGWGLVLSSLAGVYLGLAFLVAFTGLSARQLFLISASDIADALDGSYPDGEIPALEWACVERNVPVGIRLNNAITAAQTSLVMSVILSSASATLAVA
jgi:hypothetical protein